MKKATEKKKSASSYLDSIGSGYESKTVEEGKPQTGKAHEEEVAKSNNWTGDKRDPVGKAAAKKLARKLGRIASEVEAFSDEYMEEEYAEDIKDTAEDMKDEVEDEEKQASHPTVNPTDKPAGEMDARTGDEWFDVTIEDWKNDKRDNVGKAE